MHISQDLRSFPYIDQYDDQYKYWNFDSFDRCDLSNDDGEWNIWYECSASSFIKSLRLPHFDWNHAWTSGSDYPSL